MTTAVEWIPGEAWTHPSVQKLTDDELRMKLRAARDILVGDKLLDGDTSELLRMGERRVRTYQRALKERGLA